MASWTSKKPTASGWYWYRSPKSRVSVFGPCLGWRFLSQSREAVLDKDLFLVNEGPSLATAQTWRCLISEQLTTISRRLVGRPGAGK